MNRASPMIAAHPGSLLPGGGARERRACFIEGRAARGDALPQRLR